MSPLTEAEREWAAQLFAQTDPWRRLGTTVAKCREVCSDPAYQAFVARAGDEKCGVLVLQKRGIVGAPYIRWIAVAATHRNCGVGAAMMAFAENLFQPEASHIFLCVSSFNRRAQSFYQRLGYRQVGEIPDLIIGGESELLLHKRLA